MTGMIKVFLGFEIFDSGMFLGRKIWQVFFFGWLDLSSDFLGFSKQSEDLWCTVPAYPGWVCHSA